ncbi:MAG: hypothetical protein ACR2N9_04820, partial [Acidimicrobiia bacterium]
MRGVAVLCAAAASWVLVTGVLPRLTITPPSIPLRYVAVAGATMVITGVVSFAALGVAIVAVAMALLAAMVPITIGQQRERAYHGEVRDAWPDVLSYTR